MPNQHHIACSAAKGTQQGAATCETGLMHLAWGSDRIADILVLNKGLVPTISGQSLNPCHLFLCLLESTSTGPTLSGQGLALAIEDAVVLAWHLKREGLTEAALRRYCECVHALLTLTSVSTPQNCNVSM